MTSSFHSTLVASQLSNGGRVRSPTSASRKAQTVLSIVQTVLADTDEAAPTKKDKIYAFLFKWHLPIFFILVLFIGYVLPAPGKTLQEADLGGICLTSDACVFDSVSDYCVAFIFINSGMRLKTDEVKKAFKEWKAVLYGVIAILLLTPLITFWTITFDFSEPEFAIGISLFFAQATSLSSGPTISAQANGNVALALLLTVITNILGVVTMPLFVTNFLRNQSSDVEVNVETLPIIAQLIFLILFPMLIGKATRFSERVIAFTLKRKVFLKLASSVLLATIIWLNISASQEDLKETSFGSIALLFIPALGIHLLFLIFNYSVVRLFFRLKQPEKRSVVIMTSCKSLPVALTVLQLLDEEAVGSRGLVAIPMIACHFVQVVFDAFLAAYWADKPIENEVEDELLTQEGTKNPTFVELSPSGELDRGSSMRQTL